MKRYRTTSPNTVNRLPKYIRLMDELDRQGLDHISSNTIGRMLGMTPSQVRQDLSNFGNYGAQGYGYNIKALRDNLKKVIGLDRTHNVVIVGVGSIGKALLCHMRFKENNYNVVAAFDTKPELIGTILNEKPVFHSNELKALHQKTPIDVCILTVPAEKAKACGRTIAEIGIPAIWNLTNVDLDLDESDVIVENMHFLDSLFSLTFYLKEHNREKPSNH